MMKSFKLTNHNPLFYCRCACNGHSSRCGTSIDSVCQCVHNTEGDNCERCAALYNDKPWRYGTTSNGFPCKLCDCNGHAISCVYNASTDPFPNSYDIGGGGVCENCQDNTGNIDSCDCRSSSLRLLHLLVTFALTLSLLSHPLHPPQLVNTVRHVALASTVLRVASLVTSLPVRHAPVTLEGLWMVETVSRSKTSQLFFKTILPCIFVSL